MVIYELLKDDKLEIILDLRLPVTHEYRRRLQTNYYQYLFHFAVYFVLAISA